MYKNDFGKNKFKKPGFINLNIIMNIIILGVHIL